MDLDPLKKVTGVILISPEMVQAREAMLRARQHERGIDVDAHALLSEAELTRALQTAETAARAAGSYLLSRRGSARVAYLKAPLDEVLDVDVASEQLILRHLRADFGAFGVLSEEAGGLHLEAPYRWIVDPLDGSVNYAHDLPLFAVAIALSSQDVTLASVIYLPATDELFTAASAHGALRNGARISISPVASLEHAIIHIGELERIDPLGVSARQLEELSRVAHRAKRIRLLGSSSVDLALVSCGRADALIMHGGNAWDVAPGALLLREAGGQATTVPSESGVHLNIYSNGHLHEELLEVLQAR